MPRRIIVPGLFSLCVVAGAQAVEPIPVIPIEGELPEKLGEVIVPQQ